jgi:hypothetical protein
LHLQSRELIANSFSKHLEARHKFTNDNLYLVEPKGQDTEYPDKRRGLCKVCYQVFDYFEKPEDHVEDIKLKGHVEEHYLQDHVKFHTKMANGHGKQNISPDNHGSAAFKFLIMQALFPLRQSVDDIRAQHRIPLPGKAITVKCESQTPLGPVRVEDPVSFAGHCHTVHTPLGSVSSSSLKRSSTPLDETHTPARPQKQHKGKLLAFTPTIVPSPESSPQAPSLGSSNKLSPSHSSRSACVDPNLEHALPSAQKSPTPAARNSHTSKLDTVTPLAPSIQEASISVHATQGSQLSSSHDSPKTLPLADNPIDWSKGGLFWDFEVKKHFRIERPLVMPNGAILLTDGTVVSLKGQKVTMTSDGCFTMWYDPSCDLMYDSTQQFEQGRHDQDAGSGGVLTGQSATGAGAEKV